MAVEASIFGLQGFRAGCKVGGCGSGAGTERRTAIDRRRAADGDGEGRGLAEGGLG